MVFKAIGLDKVTEGVTVGRKEENQGTKGVPSEEPVITVSSTYSKRVCNLFILQFSLLLKDV